MSKITDNLPTDTIKTNFIDKTESKISSKLPQKFDAIEISKSNIQNPVTYNSQAILGSDNTNNKLSYEDLNNERNFINYVDIYVKLNEKKITDIEKNQSITWQEFDEHLKRMTISLMNQKFLPIKNEELGKLSQIIENTETPIELREAAIWQILDYNVGNAIFDSLVKILNNLDTDEVLVTATLFKLDDLASTRNFIPNNVLEAIDKFVPTIEIASRIYQHLILNNNQSVPNQALDKLSEAINNNYFGINTKKFISFIFVKIFEKGDLSLNDVTVNNLIEFIKNNKNSITSRHSIMCILDSNKTMMSNLSRNKIKSIKF